MKTRQTLHLLCGLLALGWLSLQATAELSQENVAMGKTYHQISNYSGDFPSKAANGNRDEKNCTRTNYSNNLPVPNNEYHWWEVDLGRIYPVRDITVWALRKESDNHLYPFTITVDNQTCVSVTSPPIYGTRNNSVTCTSVMYGSVVRLTLINAKAALNLCEFQIFVPSGVSQCPAGHHGKPCGQTCSDNCGGGPGKNFCYQDTGVCYDGCAGNFAGDTCRDCKSGYKGDKCTQPSSGNRTAQSGRGASFLLPLFLGVLLAFICPL